MRSYAVLQFFRVDELGGDELRDIGRRFQDLARHMASLETDQPSQVGLCLNKLLEARDAAIRSRLPLVVRLDEIQPPKGPP